MMRTVLVLGIQVVFINLFLSIDNVSVIALAIKGLSPLKARAANLLGVSAAFILRMFFIFLIGMISSIPWLHTNLICGVILLYITWNMTSGNGKSKRKEDRKAGTNSFFKAVLSIIVADASMSLDNALAVSSVLVKDGTWNGIKMALVFFGLVICIPIIFWGSNLMSQWMKKYPIIIYLCECLLVFIAVKMIFADQLITSITGSNGGRIENIAALSCAIILFCIMSGSAKNINSCSRRGR